MTEEILTRAEINCTTGEVIIVPLTADEIAQMEAVKANEELRQAKLLAEQTALAELKASAKAKLIAGEPLTEEEAATIVF